MAADLTRDATRQGILGFLSLLRHGTRGGDERPLPVQCALAVRSRAYSRSQAILSAMVWERGRVCTSSSFKIDVES